MNYQEAIDYIHERGQFGSKLGLERISNLCERLGNPQKQLKFIHVAGTNGKGSTTAYISNILKEAGYKVGTYISPFVHTFYERIQINGENIAPDDLAFHTTKAAGLEPLITEFELVTAIGFSYFAEQNCDYVVLEVGLGGRFDATNVIDAPEVAVLTAIDIDHTEYLGNTIDKIAFEKCGIIKEGCKVAIYPSQKQAAIDIIGRVCKERNVKAFYAHKGEIVGQSIEGTVFAYNGEQFEIGLLGAHQVLNASTAMQAIACLNDASVTLEHIKNGLKKTRFSGRFELIHKNPWVIIDGAHNDSGSNVLADALETYFPNKDITIVLGMLADKEYEKCIARLAPLAKRLILTKPDNPRAWEPAKVKEFAKQFTQVEIEEDRFAAVNKALGADIICICGSLYLIGGMPDFVETLLSKV